VIDRSISLSSWNLRDELPWTHARGCTGSPAMALATGSVLGRRSTPIGGAFSASGAN